MSQNPADHALKNESSARRRERGRMRKEGREEPRCLRLRSGGLPFLGACTHDVRKIFAFSDPYSLVTTTFTELDCTIVPFWGTPPHRGCHTYIAPLPRSLISSGTTAKRARGERWAGGRPWTAFSPPVSCKGSYLRQVPWVYLFL